MSDSNRVIWQPSLFPGAQISHSEKQEKQSFSLLATCVIFTPSWNLVSEAIYIPLFIIHRWTKEQRRDDRAKKSPEKWFEWRSIWNVMELSGKIDFIAVWRCVCVFTGQKLCAHSLDPNSPGDQEPSESPPRHKIYTRVLPFSWGTLKSSMETLQQSRFQVEPHVKKLNALSDQTVLGSTHSGDPRELHSFKVPPGGTLKWHKKDDGCYGDVPNLLFVLIWMVCLVR